MKAIVFSAKNAAPELLDLPSPARKPGEVRIALQAASLNHRDLWIHKGLYAGIKHPLTPGSDGFGTILESEDPQEVGASVLINPAFGWGDSEAAQGSDFTILGLPRQGTWAEEIVVPSGQVHYLGADFSATEAAALPLAGLTAYRALFSRARLLAGEKILITGIGGGVALFGLQMAVAAGAEVAVTSTSKDKLARALKMGAAAAFDGRDEQWTGQLLDQFGAPSVILDSVGGENYSSLVEVAAPGARLVNYGATTGTPSGLDLRKVFWKQLNLLGSTMGSPTDFASMVAFLAEHEIRPVVDRVFPLAEAGEALAYMDDSAQFGKIVLQISEGESSPS